MINSNTTKTTKSGTKYGIFYKDGGTIRGPLYGGLTDKRTAIASIHAIKQQIKRTPIVAKVKWTAELT